MYDFLNQKIEGMNGTYSSKIEMLSNFMMQAQDDVRDLKSVKNDSSFRLEDIKTLIDQRDKLVRDKIQENTHQVIHLQSSIKENQGFMMSVKNEINDMQMQATNKDFSTH